MNRWLAIAATIAALAWPPLSSGADAGPQPIVLRASFFSTAISLESGVLYYEHDDGGPMARGKLEAAAVRPTPAQWRDFRRALDEAEVWGWRKRYERPVTDSYGWRLRVEYADRKIDAEGYADIPELNAFKRCIYALQTLAGGRRIGDRRMHEVETRDLNLLRLVATHPAAKRSERWAEFRDSLGRIHRVGYDASAPHGYSFLYRVTKDSATLMNLVVDSSGSLIYDPVVMKKAAGR